jgi:tetratricopeptide (TPR) repeat protein
MPDFSSVSIPRPKDWQAFERQSRLLFQLVLKDPGTQNNGRQGQEQHGVDIFGREGGSGGRLVGIQCKGKDTDYGRPVTEAELLREVEKTRAFKPPLGRFILAATAGDDAGIQETARLLEDRIRAEGRELSIEIWGWGRLQQEISLYPEAIRAFHPDASPFSDQIFNDTKEIKEHLSKQAEGREAFEERVLQAIAAISPTTQIAADTQAPQPDSLDRYFHDQIDTYRDLIRDGRPKTAIHLPTKLKAQVGETASEKVRFRITSNIGAAHHLLGEYDTAADFFLQAAPHNPDDPVSLANKIAGLLLKRREGEAHAVAVEAISKHPDNPDLALQRLQARAPGESVENVWPTLSAAVVDEAPLLVFRIVALRQDGDLTWKHVLDQALRKHPDDSKLRAISAEGVLERILKADPAVLGGSGDAFPNQAEIVQAAEIFETGWNASLGRETPIEGSWAHNAALARKILGQEEAAERLLDAALDNGFDADETKRFRLYLYPQRTAPEEAIRLADSLVDSPQSKVIRANFRVDKDPIKAREILVGRDSFTDRRDMIAAALVFIESLISEGKFDEASAEADRLKSLLPSDPPWALAKYRIRSARGDRDAGHFVDDALQLVSDKTDFGTRFLISEALARAQRYDNVVDVLYGHTATTHDSPALRLLVAAAGNADRRYILKQLLEQLPRDLLELPFFRTGRIALEIRTGDVKAAEKEIREYLALRPAILIYNSNLCTAFLGKTR